MSQYSSTNIAVPLGLFGIAIGAGCTADWLSDPAVAGLMWPADINAWVVRVLGGEAGEPLKQPQLSFMPVVLRFVGLTFFALILGRLLNREVTVRSMTIELMQRLGIIGIAAGVLWGVQLQLRDEFVAGTLPPLMMLLIGVALYSVLSVCLRAPGSSGSRSAWGIMLLVTFGWICISFRLNERLYANLLIPHGDSAMYEEHLWNIWHGKGFRSYLDQGLFLGEHIQVIHLLLLPVHMIWPSHLALELAESIALGTCTVPLFLIVRRRTNNEWAACLLALSWLFFFPMHFLDIAIDQKTFRPVCLGLPFLFWTIQSAESGRLRLAWLFLLLALSAKEDMALITAPIGAVLAMSAWRDGSQQSLRNWGLAAAFFSVAWLFLAVLVVIPGFRAGDVVHYSRYFGELGSSPGELVRTAITKPTLVLAQVFSFRTLFYTCLLLAPLAFVVLRSPLQLVAGAVSFLMLSLLQLGNGPDSGGLPPVPYHHFHAPLLPVLFWAAGCGLIWFRRDEGIVRSLLPGTPARAALLVLCCCMTTAVTGSLLPFGASYWSGTSAFGRQALFYPNPEQRAGEHWIQRAQMANLVVEQIPLTARVASTDYIHTRLTHCERSYDYSGYARVVNEKGRRVPADTEYIVIDTGHRYSSIHNAGEIPELTESDDWELLPDTTNGHFLMLQRRSASE
jgi:uncharacterized membrane protein